MVFKGGMEAGLYLSLLLLLFVPSLPLFAQGAGPLLTLLFWLLLMLVARPFPYVHYPWNTTILLLNVWCWLSLTWSVDPSTTLGYCIIVSGASLLIVALSSSLLSKGFKIRFLVALMLAGVYLSIGSFNEEFSHLIYIISGEFFSPEMLLFRTANVSRISGSIGGPNTIGGVMALLIPLLIALACYGFPLRKKYSWKKNGFHGFMIVFMLALSLIFFNTLVLSFSRGAFLGLLASFATLMMIPRNWVQNLNIALLFIILYMLPEVRSEALRFYENTVDETRYIIFQNSWQLAWLVPFTGFGLGAFLLAYETYFEASFIHAHQLYLNVMVELGLPGVLLVLALSFQFIFHGIRYILSTRNDSFSYAFKAGLLALFVSLLARCLVDFTL